MLKKLLYKIYYLHIKKSPIALARKIGVRIGDRCNILSNPLATFGSEPWLVKIGNHVEITSGVHFVTHEGALWCLREIDHQLKKADFFAPIIVGNNVMIGTRSIIMPGVHIGDNVVIGAHSVVTRDVQSNSVVAGVPAKHICDINQYKEKILKRGIVETKQLNREQKKNFLKKIYPNWFI